MIKNHKLLGARFSLRNRKNAKRVQAIPKKLKSLSMRSHDTCPLCTHSEATLLSEVDREGFPCDTVICEHCDFVFNDTFLSKPEEYYSHNWGEGRWKDPEKNFLHRTRPDAYAWKRMAYISNYLGNAYRECRTVLEVGCGDGCNLLPYHANGKKVLGIDYDESFLKAGRDRGMELRSGGVDSLLNEEKFDLVMLIHSFEHMIDLYDAIDKVSRHLEPDGYVYVEVPGLLYWNRRRSEQLKEMGLVSTNDILSYIQMQHNYHFDLAHLKYFWENSGFCTLIGDEWVRCIFQKSSEVKATVPEKSGVEKFLRTVESDHGSWKSSACRVSKLLKRYSCGK